MSSFINTTLNNTKPGAVYSAAGIAQGSVVLGILFVFYILNCIMLIVRRKKQPIAARSFPFMLICVVSGLLFTAYVCTRWIVPVPAYPCASVTFTMIILVPMIFTYPVISSLRTIFIKLMRFGQKKIDHAVADGKAVLQWVGFKRFFATAASNKLLVVSFIIFGMVLLLLWILITALVENAFANVVPRCVNLNLGLMYYSIAYSTVCSLFMITSVIVTLSPCIGGVFIEHYNLWKEMLFLSFIWIAYEVVTFVTMIVLHPSRWIFMIPTVIAPATVIVLFLQNLVCVAYPVFLSFFWDAKDIPKGLRWFLTLLTCSNLFMRSKNVSNQLDIEISKLEKGDGLLPWTLNYPEANKDFAHFCEGQFCSENIVCYNIMVKLLNENKHKLRDEEYLLHIHNTYIQSGSVNEVNITINIRERFLNAINSASKTGFNDIQELITAIEQVKTALMLNLNDPFQRYALHDRFKQILSNALSLDKTEKELGLKN